MIKLILSITLCLGTGFIGSLFTASEISNWYATLNKPFISPPNWIFGPVWTILYILMGISLYLIWSANSKNKHRAMNIFLIQLGLNVLWSILFFGLKNPLMAFVEIVILWVSIFLTIKYFYSISKTASYLLIPYLVWVSFATILNLLIVYLN